MSKEKRVDVAIIGAGTAGLSACSEVRKATDNFVLIQAGPDGSTCARVGCMPSKVLLQVAHDFHRRHVLGQEGIYGGEQLGVDRRKVLQYVRSLRDHFVQGVLKTVEQLGDHNLQGSARFREPTVLEVDGQMIRAKRIIIAVGSSPVVPAYIDGAKCSFYFGSTRPPSCLAILPPATTCAFSPWEGALCAPTPPVYHCSFRRCRRL